jgi:hypothetical protein
MKILMSANGLAVALLGIFPQALMSLCAFALSALALIGSLPLDRNAPPAGAFSLGVAE